MLHAWANIAFSMAYVTFFTPPAQLHAGKHPPWTEWQTGLKTLLCLKLRLRAVTRPLKGANKDYSPSRRPYDFPVSIGSILMEWKKTSIGREWETGDQHALQKLAPFQWNGKNLLSCELENVLQRFLRVAERILWLVNSAVMAHPNCRGPGQGPVLGLVLIYFLIYVNYKRNTSRVANDYAWGIWE